MVEDIQHRANNSVGLLKSLSSCASRLRYFPYLHNIGIGKNIDIDPTKITIPPDMWYGDKNKGYDILQGLYSYAGFSYRGVDVIWDIDGANDTWLVSMHSFDMLRDIKEIGGDRARQHARYLISDWLEHYWNWDRIAWRSDITARRITNWLSFYPIFCASADEEFSYSVIDSLIRQTKYLEKNIIDCELLYDSKAFIYAAVAFDNSYWLEMGVKLLIDAIKDNVLLDGGHKSRSPEKHLIFLQNLLDIRIAINMASYAFPEIAQHCIRKMAIALRTIRQNDGGLPLFHGGGEAKGSICDIVFGHMGGGMIRPLKSLAVMGYDRLSQGRSTLLIDTGKVTANTQHLGMLAFEFSSGKDRVVVNCGSWQAHNSWENALRSTAAHSTMTISNTNATHIDVRGKIDKVNVKKHRKAQKGKLSVEAEHDGYLSRYGIIHKRTVTLEKNGSIVSGTDSLISNTSREIDIEFAIRFHLHPNISISLIKNGQEIMLRTHTGQGWIFFVENTEFTIEDSIYVKGCNCEAPRKTKQIVIYGRFTDNYNTINWCFSKI